MKAWLTILALSLIAGRDLAGRQGEIVREIVVEGNTRIGQRELLEVFQSKAGLPLDGARLQEDIRTAYARFGARVAASTEPVAGGIRLRLSVDEEVLVARVEVRGVDEKRGHELLGLVSLDGARKMLESQVRERAIQLEQQLKTEGRYFARVVVSVERPGDETVAVLDVTEGEQVAVDDIEFSGTQVDASRLRGAMQTEESTLGLFKHWLQEDVLERDLVEVQRAMRDEGFRDARVFLDDLAFDEDQEWVDIGVRVEEGERYRVASVAFSGNTAVTDQELAGLLRLQVGSPLRTADLERDVRAILDRYGVDGYVRCRVDPELGYAEQGTAVAVRYVIAEGSSKKVRDVVIRGNTETLDEVIRREVTLEPGDLANGAELKRTVDRLRALPYLFDDQGRSLVDARFRETSDPLLEDLFIDVEETQFGRFFFTAGAATGVGFFAGVQLQKNNFDITGTPSSWNPVTLLSEFWRNEAFHGGGQQLDISILPGNQVTNIQVTFAEPYLSGPEPFPWSLELGLYSRTERIFDDFEQGRFGISSTFAKRLNDRWTDGLTLRLEGVDVDHVDGDAPEDVKDVEGINFVPTLGGFVRYRDVDNPLSPQRGLEAGARYELLFADGSGNRLVVDGNWYRPLFSDDRRRDHVLALRGVLGLAAGFGGELPFFERFNAGGVWGEFPLRGFEFRRIGPEKSGTHLGGAVAYSTSAEYRYPIHSSYDPVFDQEVEWVRGVVFVDLGSVEDKIGDLLGSPRLAVGAGVRIRIPILGPVPVALDLGLPVISQADDKTEVLSIRISTRL